METSTPCLPASRSHLGCDPWHRTQRCSTGSYLHLHPPLHATSLLSPPKSIFLFSSTSPSNCYSLSHYVLLPFSIRFWKYHDFRQLQNVDAFWGKVWVLVSVLAILRRNRESYNKWRGAWNCGMASIQNYNCIFHSMSKIKHTSLQYELFPF